MITDKRESDVPKTLDINPSNSRLNRNRPAQINIASVREHEEQSNNLLLPGKKAPQPT